MTGDEFAALADRYAAGLNEGDASAAAACFAEDVDYHDPLRYHFGHRADLLPFFEPPDGGHRVTWHRILFDEAAQAGLLEYTYEGHHRYHGAAIAEIGPEGLIHCWREWQHVDDERDWDAFLAGRDAARERDRPAPADARVMRPRASVREGVSQQARYASGSKRAWKKRRYFGS